jgi:hypothetical protein
MERVLWDLESQWFRYATIAQHLFTAIQCVRGCGVDIRDGSVPSTSSAHTKSRSNRPYGIVEYPMQAAVYQPLLSREQART